MAVIEGGKGFSRLIAEYAREVKDDINTVLGEVMTEWQAETIRGWPVDKGYSRSTISTPRNEGQGVWSFSVTAEYAGVIEYGGYRVVGPKTHQVGAQVLPGGIAVNGGIYPTQRPAAPVRRGMSKVKSQIGSILASKVRR